MPDAGSVPCSIESANGIELSMMPIKSRRYVGGTTPIFSVVVAASIAATRSRASEFPLNALNCAFAYSPSLTFQTVRVVDRALRSR